MPHPLTHQLHVLRSTASSALALWRGTSLRHAARQPPMAPKLFDLEGHPHCRSVREALTDLGLDVEIYPCPLQGKRFQGELQALSGASSVPMLLDPNCGTVLRQPQAIVDHLFTRYGDGHTPAEFGPSRVRPLLGAMASALRGVRGLVARPSRRPPKLLHLWSFESSPYARLVRERLCELELPYVLHNLGKEQWADMGPAVLRLRPGPYRPKAGGRRESVLAEWGKVQIPCLEDPNTGLRLFESRDIISYLERQYAKKPLA
ncbi:MAG: glutathione S-transferase N-terminal domain-containing protein [Rhodoferax sp.]